MICGGCNAIELADVPATDGSRVCTYCPHRAMREKIGVETQKALERIQERRKQPNDRAKAPAKK
jgi:hypothetical protein